MFTSVPDSSQIRASFLEFFASKAHTILSSDNVGYESRDGARIFTNAGMNQFVPIFLGEREADVDTWPGVLRAGRGTRASDTQKCIRAGGKHNDLEDVGLDTYHHTFFEMLGNWSFGDYFKAEAIAWAWELLVDVWGFPPERLYATIYQPEVGDPAERDEEAWGHWAERFRGAGLDPMIHIVNGSKKDNFWMMADTGPCGPCTEIHVDLRSGPRATDLEAQRSGALLVNGSDARCIEIWNNVFIQYNANADGSFTPLPAQHVDTGMGFERVVSVIQGTKGLTDFQHAKISNYETDVFRPIFDQLEKLSGMRYAGTLPVEGSTGDTEQERVDVAFRVIADHLRTLSFAIADGILPGNSDRNYTLRRILRRAVKYGRSLGFGVPFVSRLVATLVEQMGGVFRELRVRQTAIEAVLLAEEESFFRTLDKGVRLFEEEIRRVGAAKELSGAFAFRLYDQEGFPLDLTELMAREHGFVVDTVGFDIFMAKQRHMARSAMRRQVVELTEIESREPTIFTGYDEMETVASVKEIVVIKNKAAVVLDRSVCYAEMGGQAGDTGRLEVSGAVYPVVSTTKVGHTWLHFMEGDEAPEPGQKVCVVLDGERRRDIERHHTATHLLHWALHEVVSADATQKGSSVMPGKLTFDFNSGALSDAQVRDVERLVNGQIMANNGVFWKTYPYEEVRENRGVMQLFGEKYGDFVRVVSIGGAGMLDGYSMELCGGTHTARTGDIGHFRILSEGAVAAGVRRIEAVAGWQAYEAVRADADLLGRAARMVRAQGAEDLEKKIELLLQRQSLLEKELQVNRRRDAARLAKAILVTAQGDVILENLGEVDAETAMAVCDALKVSFRGIVVLGSHDQGNVTLVATVPASFQSRVTAGDLIRRIAPMVGGKGGGKPDFARGGGSSPDGINAALGAARAMLG